MAVTRTIEQPRLYSATKNTNLPLVGGCNEANSSTFIIGDLVYLNSGAVTVCGDDPTVIAGLATKAGTNVTSGNIEIPIEPINSDDIYVMNIWHTTDTSAVLSSITIGTAYEIARKTVGSATAFVVDMAATTNERVVVVGKHPSDASDDLYGRVLVKFLPIADDNSTIRYNILQLCP